MAYVDQNGLVLIDENEAADDIKKLNSAKETMIEALGIINNMVSINSVFKGYVADTINNSAAELNKRVDVQKTAIEEEISFINQVVERYKIIDENMRKKINSSI